MQLDKTLWGPGPWQEEPDRHEWRYNGLPCLIRRGRIGVWCGYVGVAPGHPFYDEEYDEPDVSVHGGLTYGSRCDGEEGEGICHVPLPGEAAEVFWLGFDCGHAGDLIPRWNAYPELQELSRAEVYWTMEMAMRETEYLADQIADYGS